MGGEGSPDTCTGLEAGAVCSPDHGRKEVLKHPTETNTAIQYGLFGCIYQEAIRIQPTLLLRGYS